MANNKRTNRPAILDQADLPLVEGENPDLLREAETVAGAIWVDQPNSHLGGDSPRKLINQGRGAAVRDLLRTIKYVGFS